MRAMMFVAAIILTAACDRGGDARVASLATELNPRLATLKDSAWYLLLNTGWDDGAVQGQVNACTSNDASLEQIKLLDTRVGNHSLGSPDVAEIVRHLLDDRHLYCGDKPVERCARWCVVTWTRLVLAVEDLRARAAANNVEIISISPLDPRNRLAPGR